MIYKTGRIIFSEVDKEQKIVEKQQQKTFIFFNIFSALQNCPYSCKVLASNVAFRQNDNTFSSCKF